MAYLQAALVLVVVLFALACLFGAGLTIVAVGMAVGAIVLLVFGLYVLVSNFWAWLTNARC